MKLHRIIFQAALMLVSACALGQGTFIYDQQSSTNDAVSGYGGTIMQHLPAPWGQSFTPSLAAVGFVRLMLNDGDLFDGLGATVYVNLRSGITGPILGSTAPVHMPNLFHGVPNFFFDSPVPVTPGVTYYLEPILQGGPPANGTWNIVGAASTDDGGYTGGSAYSGGNLHPPIEYWFREGIVVPEPSAGLLLLVGSGLYVYVRRPRIEKRS